MTVFQTKLQFVYGFHVSKVLTALGIAGSGGMRAALVDPRLQIVVLADLARWVNAIKRRHSRPERHFIPFMLGHLDFGNSRIHVRPLPSWNRVASATQVATRGLIS